MRVLGRKGKGRSVVGRWLGLEKLEAGAEGIDSNRKGGTRLL